jgi:hypothetical protein
MYGAQFLNSEFLMSSCCPREEQRNISIVIPVIINIFRGRSEVDAKRQSLNSDILDSVGFKSMSWQLGCVPPKREEERHDLENVFGDYCRAPATELFKFMDHMLIHCLICTTLISGEGDSYILLSFGRKSQQLPSIELLLLRVPYHNLIQRGLICITHFF